MDFTTDVHVEAAQIQDQIEDHLGIKGIQGKGACKT
jgi:hypothetical protein